MFATKHSDGFSDNVGVVEHTDHALLRLARGELSIAEVMGIRSDALERLVDEAMARASAGQLEEAEESLRNLAVVHSGSPLLPCLLGGVRAEQGDAEGAVSAYTESLRRAALAQSDSDFVAEVMLLRAAAFRGAGDVDSAHLDLRTAASLRGPAAEEAQKLLGVA